MNLVNDDYAAFIIANRYQITSVSLHNESHVSYFRSLLTDYTLFKRLESINFERISVEILTSLLIYLPQLPRLFSLKINLQCNRNLSDIYSLIFQLPVLKYTKISALGQCSMSPFAWNLTQSNSIKYLDIDCSNDINDIFSIVSHTPYLRHLTCRYIQSIFTRMELLNNLHLKYVCFKCCYVQFEHLEILIKNSFLSVEVFRIGSTVDSAYIDAIRWETLILQYIPHLRILDCEYWEYNTDGSTQKSYHTKFNDFQSPFWKQRKWFLELKSRRSLYLPDQIIITYRIKPIK